MLIEHTKILRVIEKLKDLALEVEADVGATPTAVEALQWLESEIFLIVQNASLSSNG